MAKRATKAKEEPRLTHATKRSATTAQQPLQPETGSPPINDLVLNAVLVEAQQRTFATEQEALAFFYERLLEMSAEDLHEKAQMREFLELLVETDPALKTDLLAAVKIRK